jgi:hypothetical protein
LVFQSIIVNATAANAVILEARTKFDGAYIGSEKLSVSKTNPFDKAIGDQSSQQEDDGDTGINPMKWYDDFKHSKHEQMIAAGMGAFLVVILCLICCKIRKARNQRKKSFETLYNKELIENNASCEF